MNHPIDQLEKGVEALIQLVESSRRENARLRQENEQLFRELEGREALQGRNQELEDQLNQLRAELGEQGEKDSHVRERLQGILSKIDSIQAELSAQSGPAHGGEGGH